MMGNVAFGWERLKDIVGKDAKQKVKETKEQEKKTDRNRRWFNDNREWKGIERGLQKLCDTWVTKSRHRWLYWSYQNLYQTINWRPAKKKQSTI